MDNLDISKLQSETLQLRSQQFQIITLALASTGISAWLIPIISSRDSVIDDKVILIATSCWIFLLGIFFSWSLSLKRLIDVIAYYLKNKHNSEWEDQFYRFHRKSKLHLGQTKYSLYIFWSYGVIVTISGIITIEKYEWRIVLGIIGLIYLIFCYAKYKLNPKPNQIEIDWQKIFKNEDKNAE